MAFVLADRVKDTTTSTGTGTITLANAPPVGFQSFAAIGNANNTYYTITGVADWEVGIGTYTAAGTLLSRDTVLSSSNAGAAVNFPAGSKDVFVTYPSSKAVMTDVSQTLSAKTLTGVSVNVTGDVTAGANSNVGSANSLIFSTRSALRSPADSVFTLFNNAQTDFGRLQFGGTTASFPAIKRSGAALQVRLADDTGFASLTAASFILDNAQYIAASSTTGFILNAAGGGGSPLLLFGGTTASFPALKRSGSSVEARLADDSAYTVLRASTFVANNGTRFSDSGDGIAVIYNSATTDFTRLNFGGTTSAFPALAKNSTALESKLADNSGYADFSARKINGLGTATSAAGLFFNLIEKFTVSATAAGGTINLDAATQSCLYYTTNATANWTVNLRLSATGSMNSTLAVGESMTFTFAATQGATAFYNNVVQVDATTSGVTTKWLGATPIAGNINSVDVYTYCVAKTAAATYTVFASLAAFK